MKRICTILIFAAVIFNSLIFAQNDRQLEREKANQKNEKRTALVIGNGNYTIARKLANPANDATDMAQALTDVGFEVISGTNLNLKQMTDKVREFGDKLKANGGVGLFYFAGHGVQVNGKNYLIPVEADVSREDEIDFAALNFEIVLRKMATANNGLNIVVLDACRNNPFARSWSRDTNDGGLAQISAPTGTFIAYATSPDKTASDGEGRNGLYTSQLLKIIRQPNLKIEEAFKQVTIAVDKESKGNQIPWVSSSLRGEFYFKKSEVLTAVTNNQTEPTILAKDKVTQEKEAWDLVKNSSDAEDFRYYLKEFPNGANAEKAKIRLEELVWLAVRNSTDKTKIQAYLNEFPSGANISAARIKLRQMETATTTPTTTQNSTNNNSSNTTETKGAIRKNSIEMELVYIPSGSFMMGSEKGEDDAKPVRQITIQNGFWMGKYEVTIGEWKKVMGDITGLKSGDAKFRESEYQPMIYVSWNDAKEFIAKLNAKNDGFEYSLPSEAQWEYAARAGTTTEFAFGDSLSSEQANFNGEYPYGGAAKGKNLQKTVEVGLYKPNAFGLYDMHGNVLEWVEDIYSSSYGFRALPTDGSANLSVGDSSLRVLRGGSWNYVGNVCRSAYRSRDAPANRYVVIGFRLVARARSLS